MRKTSRMDGLTGLAELGPLGVHTWFDGPARPQPSSYERQQAARRLRARLLGRIIARAARGIVTLLRGVSERYRAHREARLAYEALRELDDRALRDLGLDRSEIGSVSAEAAGMTERTRMLSLS
jgi:uncharacterized protein YjiS (DUF1127 family)